MAEVTCSPEGCPASFSEKRFRFHSRRPEAGRGRSTGAAPRAEFLAEHPGEYRRFAERVVDAGGAGDGDGGSPADGTLLAVAEKDLEYGGLYRLNLEQPQVLKAGERFSVVARLTSEGDGGAVYQVPVHRDVNESSIEKYGDKVTTCVTAVVNEGESFLCSNGAWEDWKDWKDCIERGKKDGTLVTYYDYDNFPIKVYSDAAGQGASAFSGCKKLHRLQLATKKLAKRGVSCSLDGSSVKTVKLKLGKAALNKAYASKHAKIFTKKNCGRAVAVK